MEGIPEGWELVRVGRPRPNVDWVVKYDGTPYMPHSDFQNKNYIIIRKIEKPKQYRPFANAAEFEPFRDRWIEYTSPNHGDCSFYRVTSFHSERVWLGPDNSGKTYREAFHCLKFDDGTPFGIEVTE